MMLTIIDYNAGNIRSIKNMLRKIGTDSLISGQPKDICNASKLILPGVGSFDHGVQQLRELGLFDAILKMAHAGTPLLGICLGAQLLGKSSEEGRLSGFGLFDMVTKRFDSNRLSRNHKIPHMGWNTINQKIDHPVWSNIEQNSYFYFVHSYFVSLQNHPFTY